MRPTPDCLFRPRPRGSAPKGRNRIAQGFNPGYDVLPRRALKGHQTWWGAANSSIQDRARTHSIATFRAHSVGTRYPGLKPWAILFRPFRADDEDSLSDEACFPLRRPRLAIRRSRKDEIGGAGNP